jgi:hypothetical protein
MLLSLFFDHIKRTKTLPEGKVFAFSDFSYPLLFFYHLINFLRKYGLHIEVVHCTVDTAVIKALLSTMSFSGQTIYWLEDFHILPDKKQQELFQYFRAYEGPHRILLFSDKIAHELISPSKKFIDGLNVIKLPSDITPQDFSSMRFLVSDTLQERSNFAAQIGMYADYLSLDTMCLFAHYELVLGKNVDDFFTNWIARIIDPTSSFFVLSQHFFAKKPKQFFRQWATVSEQYLPTFWASFWADQIWRAYVYADLMKQKKYADAKKVQYKLPFSFINRDWLLCNLSELRNAHHFLTSMDFRLKNGGYDIGLEHFYSQFFENKFQ